MTDIRGRKEKSRVIEIMYSLICLATALCAAGENQKPTIAFEDLEGITRYPLAPGDKAASVLIFYWHDCPICNSYAPEINRISASHTNFASYIVQIDPDLTVAAAKKHARDYDLHPPVLLDPKHRLVEAVKATVTPQAVIVGRDGKIRYRGRIDDLYAALGKRRAAAKEHDLIAALEDIQAGRAVRKKETKAIGCVIQPVSREAH